MYSLHVGPWYHQQLRSFCPYPLCWACGPGEEALVNFALALLFDIAHASWPGWLAGWFVYSIYCEFDVYSLLTFQRHIEH